MKTSETSSVEPIVVKKVVGNSIIDFSDILSIEEPLEIRVAYQDLESEVVKNISVTMRTPGNDKDLALGFLFTENIISSVDDVDSVESFASELGELNIIQVNLSKGSKPNLKNTDRNFYTTSSCGVCGKSSIESIKTVSPFKTMEREKIELSPTLFYQLPLKLKKAQDDFSSTGGIHASGLFDFSGELVSLREDVGRHNALDKLIGFALSQNQLPLNQHMLLLSGRASFELIQKAVMAGITIIASIGAPSSLAVELAQENDITLIGFLKENRFNIYHLSKNVKISTHES